MADPFAMKMLAKAFATTVELEKSRWHQIIFPVVFGQVNEKKISK